MTRPIKNPTFFSRSRDRINEPPDDSKMPSLLGHSTLLNKLAPRGKGKIDQFGREIYKNKDLFRQCFDAFEEILFL
jgi:hypothetical protein